MNCSDQQTSLELTVDSLEGFQIFNHLISLNLSGLIIKESAVDCLVKVFCNNLQLEQLFMNKCRIHSSTINVLCRQLKFNSLKTFELNSNFMDDKAIEELAIAVLNWGSLESIILEENQFSTQGMFLLNMLTKDLESEVIIKFLNNDCVLKSFIKVLDYASKNTGKGVKQFLNNFRKVTEVSLRAETPFSPKELALSCVDIDKLIAFTKNVCLPCKQLRKLELNGIYFTSNCNIIIFTDCLSTCPILQKLILTNCNLDSTSAVRLFSHRQQSPTAFQKLTNLDLSHNLIGKDAVNSLVNSILQMPKLMTFCVIGNQVGNHLDTIFRIILDWKSAKSSVTYYKTSNVDGTDHISAFFAILSSAKDISRKDSCQINNIIKINKLVLKNLHYEVPLLNKDASYFVKRFTDLQELNLTGICIEKNAISVINDALTNNLALLQILVLCKCKLNSDSVKSLLFFTQNATPVAFNKLTIVDLSHNLMDDEALEPLVNSFLRSPNLQKLQLCGNKFSNIMAILTILYNWRNKTSEINYSSRHDARAYTSAFFTLVSCIKDAIFEESLIKNITAVGSLSLANHDHDNPIILTKVVATFFQRFTNLTELHLSGIHIHIETIRSIGCTLQNNPGLLKLKLNRCQLDSDLVKVMFYQDSREIVLMNLKSLDLNYNSIDDKVTSTLIRSLIQMPKLVNLNVANNRFSTSNEIALNSILHEFSSYKPSIDFNNADNSMKCIEAFLIVLSAINDISKRNSNQIQNIARVEKLDQFLHCKEYLKLSKEASLFFANFFRLTTLNLSGICITASVSKNLAKALQNNHRFLQILVLSHCKLDNVSVLNLFGINTDDTATQFSRTSITFHNLSTLDISNNDIKNDAACPLITLFLQMPKLAELNIEGNYFSEMTFTTLEFLFAFNKGMNIIDSNISTICRYRPQNISNSFLQKPGDKTHYGALLHYDYSFINLYCIYNRTIVSYKPSVYALAFIDLLECAINVESIQVRNILNLEKLILDCTCVEQNTILSKNVFKFLTSLPNLKELKLSGVSVNTEAVTVEKFSSLQKLTLAKCHLSSKDTITILSLLNKCTITDLCLSHNCITCKARNAIKEFVDKNKILINIDLSYNDFKDEGATIIVQSLQTCSCLKTFNLNHNSLRITDEFIYQLVTSLLKMSNCVEVDISGNNFKKHIDTKSITEIIMNCRKLQRVVKYDNKSLDYVNSFITLIGCLQSNRQEIFSESINIATAQKLCLQHFQCNIFCELAKETSLFFKKFSNLIEMKLNGIFISTAACQILAETIAVSLTSLQFLELSHCVLDTSSAIAIVYALKRRRIKELCLSHNKIDYNAASALKSFLENNIILNKFDISHNHIRTEGIKVISPTLVGCKGLESLNLSYNDITDEATVPLVSSLVQMPNLTEVRYQGNDYNISQVLDITVELKTIKHSIAYHSDQEVSAFLKLLACVKDVPTKNSPQVQHLKKIEKLCLKISSHTQPINETGALVTKQFTRLTTSSFEGHTDNPKQCVLIKESSVFFERFTSLQTLDFYGIKLQLQAVTVFAKALALNLCALEKLNLSDCGLTSDTTIEIISSLRKENLKVLCLSHNEIDFNAMKVISDFVLNNTILTEINISNNKVNTEGIVTLTEGLSDCRNLEKLDLSHNRITDDATESLHKLMKQFYQYGNFKSLQIENNYLSQQSIKTIQSAVSWSMWLKHKIHI